MTVVTGLILLLTLASLGLSAVAVIRRERLVWRFAVAEPPKATGAPRFQQIFDYTADTGQAHSPAILIEEGGFSIVWFEGSEEAQADVDIFASRFRPSQEGWHVTAPAPLLTRQGLGDVFDPAQLVVTLGNAIENEAERQAVFATVVSVGGWAMASVADVRLGVDGTPVAARKLNLSPFLNRSALVKSPMVAMADGTHALPAYFEMGATYGLFVRLDADGRVCDARRIPGENNKPIQPMIVPQSDTEAVAYLRDFEPTGRLLVSHTENGGQSWSPSRPTALPNPSAPVAALPVGEGRILLAMNDHKDRADSLSLALLEEEGRSWRPLHRLEDGTGDARYPMLRRLPGGDILLTYSHGTKGGIRAHLFNQAWVDAQ